MAVVRADLREDIDKGYGVVLFEEQKKPTAGGGRLLQTVSKFGAARQTAEAMVAADGALREVVAPEPNPEEAPKRGLVELELVADDNLGRPGSVPHSVGASAVLCDGMKIQSPLLSWPP